jgi:hypothetical protein
VSRDERGIVDGFNQYFENSDKVDGKAFRLKQHRFSSQLCDVLVDSLDPRFYLALEHKSVKTSSTNHLYFSQHFSESNDGHQVDRISRFVERSGRRGFLAVELKQGPGKPLQLFLVPWKDVRERFENDESGFSLEEIREYTQVPRRNQEYMIGNAIVAYV